MTVQTAIPTVNANTPFIQNVPNSYVNQAWYQMLVALAQQAGGLTASVSPIDEAQTEAFTDRPPRNDASAELLARLDSLEAQVSRLRGELADARRTLDYAQTRKTYTASGALSALALSPQVQYFFAPTTTKPSLGYLPGSGIVYTEGGSAVSVLQTNGGIALSAPVKWGITGTTSLGYNATYGMEYAVGGTPVIYFQDNGGITLTNALSFTSGAPTYASASLGGAVLPATPLGFLGVYIGGSLVKFPYYNP